MRKRYPEIGNKHARRESQIEGWSKQVARNCGWWVRKFKTPARRSAPDDIFGKHGRVFWVEFKATGDVPSDLQKHEHEVMRGAGLTVYVCDSQELFLRIFKKEDMAVSWMDLPTDEVPG